MKTPPNGVVDSMIFEIENHGIPSHYDLPVKNFNSGELEFLMKYQYDGSYLTAWMGKIQHALPVFEKKSIGFSAQAVDTDAFC